MAFRCGNNNNESRRPQTFSGWSLVFLSTSTQSVDLQLNLGINEFAECKESRVKTEEFKYFTNLDNKTASNDRNRKSHAIDLLETIFYLVFIFLFQISHSFNIFFCRQFCFIVVVHSFLCWLRSTSTSYKLHSTQFHSMGRFNSPQR